MPADDLVLHVGSGYFTPGPARLHTFCVRPGGPPEPVQVLEVDSYPTFLAASPDRRTLYVNVESENDGAAAIAFRREPSGELTRLSTARSGERQSVHVAAFGAFVAQANYASDSVTLLRTAPDGDLAGVADVARLPAGGFTHAAVPHPHDHRLFVANRTAGTVATFRVDDRAGTLHPAAPPADAGDRGPRHLVFSTDGRHLYCSDERASTVSVYRVGDDGPALLASTSTVPSTWSGENHPADLALHPSGRCLYVTNRQQRAVAVFGVEADGAGLELHRTIPVGDGPRNLSVDPSGRVLAAGVLRDDVVTLIDLEPGRGRPEGGRRDLPVPAPSGILLTPAPTE